MQKTQTISIDQLCVDTIKCLAIDAVEKANSGHPGMPMGCADLAYILFFEFLNTTPDHPKWRNRDRFVLSAGHGSMLLYAMLHLCEFDLSLEDLKQFRQWGSKTPGHPEFGHTQGVEATTGPLGQGTGNAVGMALAAKMMEAKFSSVDFNPIDHHIFALVSDGDLMEGLSSESASLAGHLGLSNLIYIYDDNKISIDGQTDLSFTENIEMRFQAYNWFVQKIDGHDHQQIRTAYQKAIKEPHRPSIIMAKTEIGKGSPNKAGKSSSHGAPLGTDETKLTKKHIGWPYTETFFVPDEVKQHFKQRLARVNSKASAWKEHVNVWKSTSPEIYKTWEIFWNKPQLDSSWMNAFQKQEQDEATRNLSNAIQQKVAECIPNLVGGSADLACSCKTLIKDSPAIVKHDFNGRNIHFGVREHAMGAMANGMSLYGSFVPYTSTFLVFSDYMRPAIRMAALSKLQSIFIFTHDSIFLGEDGPTHQPIEHLASLRMIPNLQVIRPCNQSETGQAWQWALEKTAGPSCIINSRQKLKAIHPDSTEHMHKGGYIFKDCANPDIVIVATGSEVPLAIEIQAKLKTQNKKPRVVSMPCLEVFKQQTKVYQGEVLPPNTPKLFVEAAHGASWYPWMVPNQDKLVDIQTFGSSAPAHDIATKLGYTTAAITDKI